MFNFFIEKENINGSEVQITGSDFNHIKNVLRMTEGDKFLVSLDGISSLCVLKSFGENSVNAEIIEENYMDTELKTKIYLFQGLPKGDKMEMIIQKTVELGITEITPIEMEHCVVKLDSKKKKSKVQRWQAISESAAKQSKRNIIPKINEVLSFKDALEEAKNLDLVIVPYENKDGMKATSDALSLIKEGSRVGLFIGPEGGFSKKEIDLALESGGKAVSLGRRILRTETAAITAVAMVMLHTELNSGEEV